MLMASKKKENSYDKEAAKNLSKTKAELTGINKNKGEEIRLRRNLDVLEKEKKANINISKSQEQAMKMKLEKLKKLKDKKPSKSANAESYEYSDEELDVPLRNNDRRRSTISSRPTSGIAVSNGIRPSTSAGHVRDSNCDMYGRRNTVTTLGLKPEKIKELASGSSSRDHSPSRYRPSTPSGMKRSVTDTKISSKTDN